jgi:hypothetical protein
MKGYDASRARLLTKVPRSFPSKVGCGGAAADLSRYASKTDDFTTLFSE